MATKKNWSGCGCPKGSKRISTKGRGRGWACQSLARRRTKKGGSFFPFVKAHCR